jgi:hypothetical protein
MKTAAAILAATQTAALIVTLTVSVEAGLAVQALSVAAIWTAVLAKAQRRRNVYTRGRHS